MALQLDPGHRNATAYLEAVQVGRGRRRAVREAWDEGKRRGTLQVL